VFECTGALKRREDVEKHRKQARRSSCYRRHRKEVFSWYDNEWGYANQMVREALSVTRGMGIPG
jgi:glyceraldehyde-3-phosphate dehydrogenase/erythrose-4-phosphate dehydrogenase